MLRCILLCSCMLLLVQLAHQQETTANEAPLIETTLGRIRGSTMTSRKGRDFYAYRGIYYGKAPTGQKRFSPPDPVEPWSGTLDALADGPTCPQTNPNPGIIGEVEINEDCLSLNVFTANVTASNPVIVFIHGGGNLCGNPHSETKSRPHYMLDEDVVLIGVYFRVGAFGFLTTGTPDAPGNIGYLDQVLALKWIKQHIENFGGDPNRVTLMGFSAGGLAVTAHLASPLSAGLFHRLYAVSSSATGHDDIDNLYWSRKLAHELGCPKFGAQYLLNCLRKFSWQEIVDVCGRWENYATLNLKWNYEIDGNFLVEHPNDAIRYNRFNRVPIMTGTTINDFEYEVLNIQEEVDLIKDIGLNFGLYTRDILDFESTGYDDERAMAIRQFYFNTTALNETTLPILGTVRSDCLIGHSVHRLVELANSYTNVYYYRFDYLADGATIPGVVHGDDVHYSIPSIYRVLEANSTDNFMVDRMTKLISSFAANGEPPAIENITWPPFTASDPVVMYNDRDPYTGGPYYVERYALWDRLFPLEENSAEILFPSIVVLFFVSVWHHLL